MLAHAGLLHRLLNAAARSHTRGDCSNTTCTRNTFAQKWNYVGQVVGQRDDEALHDSEYITKVDLAEGGEALTTTD